jgi:hypothetical protein
MADEIHQFAFSIPAGTPIATPVTQNLTMPPRTVVQINVKVPPGPHGLMGFKVGAAGIAVIPAIAGSWIVTDNEPIVWPLSNYINSGAWQVFGYNLGRYAHTVYLTFHCLVPGSPSGSIPTVLDATSLDNAAPAVSTMVN